VVEYFTDALFSADAADSNNQMAYDALFDAMVAGTDLAIVFGVVSNASSNGLPENGWTAPSKGGYTGTAHVTSLSLTGAKGSASSMSVSLIGSGELKRQA
jgi:uncharacterized protein YdeI (BOF family)